ncbi:MAG: BCCT family transporter, partial [Acidobacteria bacterium]|nr:BCCT family transporter [Acidobacteriota bacterium]
MPANNTQTDYRIGQDNIRFLGLDIHNPVFAVSSLTIIAFVVGVLAFREAAAAVFDALHTWLTSTFDWVFLGAGNIFILFCLLLVVTPLGRIRLGGPDARPDYSLWSWFAMLFAAGIGIGLMFFGVAEPITHFQNPPLGVDAGDTAAAQRMAIASAIFHWGLHPWAMYAVVALALAFAAYNLGLPLTLRSAFYPVLGKAVWGRFGHLIDVLTVFAA